MLTMWCLHLIVLKMHVTMVSLFSELEAAAVCAVKKNIIQVYLCACDENQNEVHNQDA